ncbi:c-type cytochrome [Microbulbifer litoralis]|uniref:c-type cytochrome n=1 Tax=Microbulbifer litoralis TaxID=2933965 RepID=UPI002027C7E5|nr:c-type cytochrome [Microbulbifer sp. GX H0434]
MPRFRTQIARLIVTLPCLLLWLAADAWSQAEGGEPLAARASNLLSYIAVDYADSVQNGEISDQSLYDQQRRNLARALELVRQLPERPGRAALEGSVLELDSAIAEKRAAEDVRRRANAAADRVAQLYQLQRSPAEMLPGAAEARALYQKRCAACHGARGEGGNRGPALDDPARMGSFSLYDIYNTLDPTADAVHPPAVDRNLSSRQRWALAVAVAHLAVLGTEPPPAQLAQRYPALVGLPGLATARPVELPADAAGALLWWRGNPDRVRALEQPLSRADGLLQLAETVYRAGDSATAYHRVMLAYREGYLPRREALQQRDAPLAAKLAGDWQLLRGEILRGAPNAEVISAFQQLRAGLAQARARLEPAAGGDRFYLWATLLFAVAVGLGLMLWFALRRRR